MLSWAVIGPAKHLSWWYGAIYSIGSNLCKKQSRGEQSAGGQILGTAYSIFPSTPENKAVQMKHLSIFFPCKYINHSMLPITLKWWGPSQKLNLEAIQRWWGKRLQAWMLMRSFPAHSCEVGFQQALVLIQFLRTWPTSESCRSNICAAWELFLKYPWSGLAEPMMLARVGPFIWSAGILLAPNVTWLWSRHQLPYVRVLLTYKEYVKGHIIYFRDFCEPKKISFINERMKF